jgi:hypothetical protein
MPLDLGNKQFFRFDMFMDVSGDIIMAGFCAKSPDRENDEIFYARYNPASASVVAKKISKLAFKVPYWVHLFNSMNPSYMDLLTHGLDFKAFDNGSCAFLFQKNSGWSPTSTNPNNGMSIKGSTFYFDITTIKLDTVGNIEWEGVMP